MLVGIRLNQVFVMLSIWTKLHIISACYAHYTVRLKLNPKLQHLD